MRTPSCAYANDHNPGETCSFESVLWRRLAPDIRTMPGWTFELLRDMSDETARYRDAYYAAKAFIEASVSENPPEDSGELYDKFIEAGRGL